MTCVPFCSLSNLDPEAADDFYWVAENTELSGNVRSNDVDVAADLPDLEVSVLTWPTNGTLELNVDGSFTYNPDEDFQGQDYFRYELADDDTGTHTAWVYITVGDPPGPNEHAPMTEDEAYATNEDTPLYVQPEGVLWNDADQDADPLTAVLIRGPEHGTLELNPDGSFTYTPDPDWNGTDSFIYVAFDGTNLGNEATVTIFVNPVADAPEFYLLEDLENYEGDEVAYQVMAYDPDSEFTFSSTLLPWGLSLDAQTGIISGTIDYTAAQTNGGNYTVTVSVFDATTTVDETFSWLVLDRNRLISPIDQLSVEGQTVAFQIYVRDNVYTELTYSATGLPAGLSIDEATGLISGTIPFNAFDNGGNHYNVSVAVTDGEETDTEEFQWWLEDRNRMVQPDDQASRDEQTITLQVVTIANAGSLTFAATGLPAGLTINSETGVISGQITQSGLNQNSTSQVTITATGAGVSDTRTFDWTILRGNGPQVLFAINGTLRFHDDFALFDPTRAQGAQDWIPVEVRLYYPGQGTHNIDLTVSSNMAELAATQFTNLPDGSVVFTSMKPLQASQAAGDVVLAALADGQAAGQKNMGNVKIEFPKDIRAASTPASMVANRIPPRVITEFTVKVGEGLQPGQAVFVTGRGRVGVDDQPANAKNGDFRYVRTDGNERTVLQVEAAGTYNIKIRGSNQTEPGFKDNLFVRMSQQGPGAVLLAPDMLSNPFSVAAIPQNWTNTFSKSGKVMGMRLGYSVKDGWQSDSEKIDDLDKVFISEQVQDGPKTGTLKGPPSEVSGYETDPATQFTQDIHAIPLKFIIGPGGTGEFMQVSIFKDLRTGATDIPIVNSGYIIKYLVFLDENDNKWKLKISKVGANTEANGFKSKAGATDPIAGIVKILEP